MTANLRNKIAYGIFRKSFTQLNLNEAAMVNSEIKTRGAVFGLYPKLLSPRKK